MKMWEVRNLARDRFTSECKPFIVREPTFYKTRTIGCYIENDLLDDEIPKCESATREINITWPHLRVLSKHQKKEDGKGNTWYYTSVR